MKLLCSYALSINTRSPLSFRSQHVICNNIYLLGSRLYHSVNRNVVSVQSTLSRRLYEPRPGNFSTHVRRTWYSESDLSTKWAAPKNHDQAERKQVDEHTPADVGAVRAWDTTQVNLRIGGNGNVVLDVNTLLRPLEIKSDGVSRVRDIFVYLPSGALSETGGGMNDTDVGIAEYETFLDVVSSRSTATGSQSRAPSMVVRVNYRLSSRNESDSSEDYRFPSPIHDVSLAFSWILKNIASLSSASEPAVQAVTGDISQEEPVPRITLFGSHIGGSLALMLALTDPNSIHAVAVHSPIVDWVGLDELLEPASASLPVKRRSRVDMEANKLQMQNAARVLINTRTKLFRNPSGFFDAFSSPLMFLRAPGRDTPLWRTSRPEFAEFRPNNDEVTDSIKRDGGIQVDKRETEEVIGEMGYGPYDDDWHTAGHEPIDQIFGSTAEVNHGADEVLQQTSTALSNMSPSNRASQPVMDQQETDLSQPISQSFDSKILDQPQLPTSHSASPTTSAQESLDEALYIPEPITRRRKVLRRWPLNARPEDVDLPWTRVYSTLPRPASTEADLNYVLHPQAKEMVDVMRKACFWGREKSLGEERVGLEVVQPDSESSVPREVVAWLSEISDVEK